MWKSEESSFGFFFFRLDFGKCTESVRIFDC